MSKDSHSASPNRITRRQQLKVVGGLGSVSLVSLAGCLGGDSDNSDNTITLGGTLPLTGASESTGQNYRYGYEATAQKINEMGGIPIGDENYEVELDVQDDATDPDRAQSIIQEQISQDDIEFFLGSFGSSVVLPQAAVTNQNECVFVQGGGGSDEIFTQGWEWIFGMFPRATRQTRNPGDFYRLEVDPGSVSIIHENDPFSQSFAEGFQIEFDKDDAPEIVGEHEIPRDATEFSSVLSALEDEDPDVLITTTHADNSQQIHDELATRQMDFDAIYHSLGPNQPGYREALGDSTNYAYTSTYWTPQMPYSGEIFESTEEFASYVRENFDEVPDDNFDYHIATGGACLVAYYHAFKNAESTDPEEVRDALDDLSLDEDESFYGSIEFTEDGDGDATKLGPAVQQLLEGTLEVVYPEDSATSDFVYPTPSWDER